MRLAHLFKAAAAATALSLLIGLGASPVAAGTTTVRWVDDDGNAGGGNGCAGAPATFDVIQDAIDASNADDVVRVCPGTYRETLNISGRPGLVLEAVKHWKATIKPPVNTTSTAGDFAPRLLDVYSNRVVVRWMKFLVPATLDGDCDYLMNAIMVDGAHNVQIRGNQFAGGNGSPEVCGMADAIIYDNDASGLAAYNLIRRFTRTAIYVSDGSDVSVYRNSIRTFAPCATAGFCTSATPALFPPQTGIQVWNASASIRRNVIKADADTGDSPFIGVGIAVNQSHVAEGEVIVVKYNRIHAGYSGLEISDSDGLYRGNDIRNGSGVGINLYGAGTAEITGNRVTGWGDDGIYAHNNTVGNNIHDNDFSGNDGTDCVEEPDSSSSTAGVIDNIWTNNVGDESTPSGLCTPAAP